jgi:hypothetical protein
VQEGMEEEKLTSASNDEEPAAKSELQGGWKREAGGRKKGLSDGRKSDWIKEGGQDRKCVLTGVHWHFKGVLQATSHRSLLH